MRKKNTIVNVKREFLKPPTINIIGMEYGVMSDSEIMKRCATEVVSSEMNITAAGSINSLNFGSNTLYYECKQCGNTKEGNACPGHPGYIRLNTFIPNTTLMHMIVTFLKIICFECGGLVLGNDTTMGIKELAESLNSQLKRGIKCRNIVDYTEDSKPIYCDEPHPHVSVSKVVTCAVILEYWVMDIKTKKPYIDSKREMFPSEIYDVFSAIRPEVLVKLKIPNELAPINYISKLLYVPANVIRADQTNFDDKRSKKNDNNIHLISINKRNKDFGNTVNVNIDSAKYKGPINNLTKAVTEFRTVPSSNQQIRTVAQQIPSKTGIIRGSILGGRIVSIARNFIGNNTYARLDEIWIPDWMISQLFIEEKICDVNREFLMQFVLNGSNIYPGCVSIKKKNGRRYNITNKNQITLENGDTVLRHLIDGDIVAFNRQPTLMKSNIAAVHIRVVKGIKMIKMNVSIAILFAADFDGDAMNVPIAVDKNTSYELDRTAGIAELVISNGRGVPIIGQVQDGVIGLALLTRDNVRFDRAICLSLFSDLNIFPDLDKCFPGVDSYSGRDVLTLLFDALNIIISYRGKPKYFNKDFLSYRTYSETEINVDVENGKFISGIIDAKAIGEKSYGSLYHKIYSKYGPQKTIDTIWYMQQIALHFLLMRGLTMSIADYIITKESLEEIKKVEAANIAESIHCTQNLYLGKLVPPTGKTTKEFFEMQQLNILNGTARFPNLIHKGIDYENNTMYNCINFGSKGKSDNFDEVSTAYGQNTINGERLPASIDGRSSQFYTHDSEDPRSRGYVDRSYFEGLTPSAIASTSQTARDAAITKALMTASSGTAYRETISSLESAILDNFRRLVYADKIRQTLYGGDGMDPRLTFKSILNSINVNLDDYDYLSEETQQLKKDKLEYTKIRLNNEIRTGEQYDTIGYIPVNYSVILEEIQSFVNDTKYHIPEKDYKKIYEKIKNFIDNLPKLYLNSAYKGPIPLCLQNSQLFFQMFLRFELCIAKIVKYSFTEKHIDMLLQKIQSTFLNNLEDPGVCAGIRACQGIIEISTQQTLSAIHSKGENKLENFKNTTHARATEKIPNPTMKIYFKPEYETNEQFIQNFSTNIEMTTFRSVVSRYQIFTESLGSIVHPNYTSENAAALKKMKLIPPPGDLLPWCIRFQLSNQLLISKQLSVDYIVNEISAKFSNIYIVSQPMQYIRIYLRQGFTKKNIPTNSEAIQLIANSFLNCIIRGIDRISTAYVKSRSINIMDDNGKITNKKIYFIFTEGTNLAEIVMYEAVDPKRTYSNAMREIEKLIGITGARNAILDSLRSSVEGAHYTHYTVFADQMTAIAYITGLDRTGSTKRGASTATLIADSNYMQSLKRAATSGKKDLITGPNSALIYGSVPRVATLYNTLQINERFVNEKRAQLTKVFDDL